MAPDPCVPPGSPIETGRLLLPPLTERWREAVIGLLGDPELMVFTPGPKDREAASAHVDRMMAVSAEVVYAKRPVVLRETGAVIGYCGTGWFDLDGRRRPELGYRLLAGARGRGLAHEAAVAMLDLVRRCGPTEMHAIIDPDNRPSQRLAGRLGFRYQRMVDVDGFHDQLWHRPLGADPPGPERPTPAAPDR